jgi:lyso-ornithine lipid O-acyltransferase
MVYRLRKSLKNKSNRLFEMPLATLFIRTIGLLLTVVVFVPPQLFVLMVFRFVPKPLSQVWPILPLLFFRCLLKVFGVRLKIAGPRPLPGTLLVANHVSWFDILAIGAIMPLSFVAKSDVKGWPFLGQLSGLQRTVYVDRRRGRHNKTDGDALTERLVDGDTMVIFAEGTNSDGIKVLPFKSTLFAGVERLAKADGQRPPVQAMSLAYSRLHDMAMGRRQRLGYAWLGEVGLASHFLFMLASGPITFELMFHEPLPETMKSQRKQMARALQAQVAGGLEDMRYGVTTPRRAATPPRRHAATPPRRLGARLAQSL